MRISDWSSDVCSSDLMAGTLRLHAANVHVWRRTLRIFSNAAHTKNRRRRHARTAGKINEGRRALRCIARLCERPLLGIWRGARLPDRHQGESPDLPRHAARREGARQWLDRPLPDRKRRRRRLHEEAQLLDITRVDHAAAKSTAGRQALQDSVESCRLTVAARCGYVKG